MIINTFGGTRWNTKYSLAPRYAIKNLQEGLIHFSGKKIHSAFLREIKTLEQSVCAESWEAYVKLSELFWAN